MNCVTRRVVRNILIYRLIIFNVIVAAWMAGTDISSNWMRQYLQHDSSKATWLIAAVFGAMLFSTFRKGRLLNRGAYVDIAFIESAAGWMFVLGMIGTFIGLSISLEGVSLENLKDVQGIQQVAVKLITGLKVEIAATVVGVIFGLWTEVNYVMLKVQATAIDRMTEMRLRKPVHIAIPGVLRPQNDVVPNGTLTDMIMRGKPFHTGGAVEGERS
jgi:hypothetical protein